MDLIERYLHAVKGHLPLKQQDDVVAELADDLRSRLDDREAELGRPLDEDEVVAILRQLGRPSHLAARYGSWQQLIGPALFPMYVHILKFAMGLALLVNVVLAAVLLAVGRPPGEALRGIVAFPFVTAIMVFGWVTIVFALIDAKVGPAALAEVHSGHKAIFDKWDPRTLPPVPRHRSTVPVWQVVLDLVGAVLVLGWWLAIPSNPFLLFGPGSAFLAPGPGLLAELHPGGDSRCVDRGGARRRALASGLSRWWLAWSAICWASPPWAPSCGPVVRTSSRWRAPTRQPTWYARWSGSIGPSSSGLSSWPSSR